MVKCLYTIDKSKSVELVSLKYITTEINIFISQIKIILIDYLIPVISIPSTDYAHNCKLL